MARIPDACAVFPGIELVLPEKLIFSCSGASLFSLLGGLGQRGETAHYKDQWYLGLQGHCCVYNWSAWERRSWKPTLVWGGCQEPPSAGTQWWCVNPAPFIPFDSFQGFPRLPCLSRSAVVFTWWYLCWGFRDFYEVGSKKEQQKPLCLLSLTDTVLTIPWELLVLIFLNHLISIFIPGQILIT